MEESPQLASETREFGFLKALYDLTGGNTTESASLRQVKKATKFDDKNIAEVISSLIHENKVRTLGIQDLIQLTYQGKQYVELIGGKPSQIPKKVTQYSIFVSHIHENEHVAKRLKEFLESIFTEGIEVFISGDPQNIPAGQDWFATIINGIRQCDCMIILCSPKSVERKWIHFEAGAAAVLDRRIIPLCFAGLRPGELPSPLDYIRTQAIDSDEPEKLKQHFEILMKEIAEHRSDNVSIPDILESDFYNELQIAHPRNQMPPFKRPRVITKR
jgi:hypothetical protein